MTIVCGTDFTSDGAAAAETAALIAKKMGASFRLVHVLEPSTVASPSEDAAQHAELRDYFEKERRIAHEGLHAEASRLGTVGPAAEMGVLVGHPDEVIVGEAERLRAELVVVGALGRRSGSRWRLGSTADRIALAATCPVLVVRRPELLRPWIDGGQPLRVVVGVDPTPVSDAAVRWLGEQLGKVGKTKVIGAHVYWPPEQQGKLHLHGELPIGRDHPEIDAKIAKELAARHKALPGGSEIELRIVGGLGRVADHLVQIAEDEGADLLAVGSHQRTAFDRLWHGSVSQAVIEHAPMSVLSIPHR